MTTLLIERRITRHAQAADAAQQAGDRDRFWQERRAMLLAQAVLWDETHGNGADKTEKESDQ